LNIYILLGEILQKYTRGFVDFVAKVLTTYSGALGKFPCAARNKKEQALGLLFLFQQM